MKLKEAMDIIKSDINKGYVVRFRFKERSFWSHDNFPDVLNGESPIKTEQEAYDLAMKFADRTIGKYIDICVCLFANGSIIPLKRLEDRQTT